MAALMIGVDPQAVPHPTRAGAYPKLGPVPLMPKRRCCLNPMMALSMTFASPVGMKPLRLIASWIGFGHRVPISASRGNQLRKAARSSGTIFWPVKKLKVYWRSMGGMRSGSRWCSILLPATIWVRDVLTLMCAMI